MGTFSRKKQEEKNDKLLNSVNTNNKFDSVQEVLNMLASKNGTKTFSQLVAEEVQTALASGGAITTAIEGAITTALAEGGSIQTAIGAAITGAIGEGGSIETWGDSRYEPKSV